MLSTNYAISIGVAAIAGLVGAIIIQKYVYPSAKRVSPLVFAALFAFIYGSTIMAANTLNDVVVICFPLIIIIAIEKTCENFLLSFFKNKPRMVAQTFIGVSYFSGVLIAKYLL